MIFKLTSLVGLLLSLSPLVFAESITTHVVAEDETAWFIAQVYYGKGSEYPKLLFSNNLKRPEDMTTGMSIRIENPKFSKKQSAFAARYSRLWTARQKALGLQVGSSLPHSKVVIPTEKIRTQDNTPHLPFTEVKVTDTVQDEQSSSRQADKGE